MRNVIKGCKNYHSLYTWHSWQGTPSVWTFCYVYWLTMWPDIWYIFQHYSKLHWHLIYVSWRPAIKMISLTPFSWTTSIWLIFFNGFALVISFQILFWLLINMTQKLALILIAKNINNNQDLSSKSFFLRPLVLGKYIV